MVLPARGCLHHQQQDRSSARVVQRRFDGLPGAVSHHGHYADMLSTVREGCAHVVGGSHALPYHAELPRTDNGLEQLLVPYRYDKRLTTGRRAAALATALRGALRLEAATALQECLDATRELACKPTKR